VKLNLENIVNTLKAVGEYLFPLRKITSKFTSIKSKKDLENFIKERAAHVTQTTLYGYLKTRIGTRYVAMLEDEKFTESINIAKWNIYVVAISDLTFYVFSYLIDKKNLKQNDAEEIFLNIINAESKNGLSQTIYDKSKNEFISKAKNVNWNQYYLNNPFKESGLALYNWSPIADELKVLDKEIVLNSIKLKWNLVENEFKNLTKDLKFS
tara:strand:- start:585 stop:1214 length:630 start_codon:yes stop_codon:yes gene_type:complete